MHDEKPEVVEGADARRHREMIEVLEKDPRCLGVSASKGTTVIFLSSPKALAAFKKQLGR